MLRLRVLLLLFLLQIIHVISADLQCSNDVEERLEDGNAYFTGRFLYEAMNMSPGENLIMSPYSVFTPLAQLALYSEGDTLSQILRILNLSNKSDIRCVFPKVISNLRAQEEVVLNVASKIFSSDLFPLTDEFLDDTRQIFDAEAESLDFTNSQASADRVNEWVEDQTNDLIKNIASPDMFTSDTRLVLANAIYFLGTWIQQFSKQNTIDRTFYINEVDTVKIPTMYQRSSFKYGEDDQLDCKVLEMFYEGGNFSLVVFLPNKIDGVFNLVDNLQDQNKFYTAYNNMRYEEVNVYLPKIKTESKFDLKDIMTKVGIVDILDSRKSNLTGILERYEPLYVSAAVQKAFAEIDEEGTEAAAANIVTIETDSISETYDFNADHPFIYFVLYGRMPIFCGTKVI